MDVLHVPEVFLKLDLGTRSEKSFFLDLSNHLFSGYEKWFLCNEISHNGLQLEATHTNKGDGLAKLTVFGVCERYQIPRRTLRDWMDRFKKGLKLYDSDATKPTNVDGIGDDEINDKLFSQTAQTTPVFMDKFPELLVEKKRNTLERKGVRVHEGMEIKVTQNEVWRYKRDNHIHNRKPQDLTESRLKALLDVRLTFKFACTLEAFSGHLSAEYKWNSDATTVVVKRDRTDALVCCICEKGESLNSSLVPNAMNLLIKWFHLVSAAGECGDLVLIAAVPDMEEGEFFAQRIMGLTNNTMPGTSGWLYLCNSRNGNAKLWQHWFAQIVLPTLTASDSAHQHIVSCCLLFSVASRQLIFLSLHRAEMGNRHGYSYQQTAKPAF